MTDWQALHETLDAAARAVHLAEAGQHAEAQAVLWEATAAAAGVFPWCSFESICLDVLIGAIADQASEETAA